MLRKLCISAVLAFSLTAPLAVYAANPIATDSRVRTYVYGENEVFRVVAKYGFQSNIEFANKEQIETVSVGDSVAWKITPAGQRLFVKALKEGVTTNLTVVTNKRAYQFELTSKFERDEDLIYVVRFYYPELDFDGKKRRPSDHTFESGALIDAAYNFNYSLNGPSDLAPIKVFDDGQFTFFKFRNNNAVVPGFNAVDPNGSEVPLVSRTDGEYVIVERVLPQFSLRRGDDVVCVFNDNIIQAPKTNNNPQPAGGR
ncbi:MAG: P-type conjugative transfer protein VirB9 [Proteobacteria bacterium]|nr:P-type conjugative transfer protein VirB9 [Pseudomonadota bacterium]